MVKLNDLRGPFQPKRFYDYDFVILSSSFLQNSVLIMQSNGTVLALFLAWLVHKSANVNQKVVAASILFRECFSFEKSRDRGDVQCMLPNYCAKLVSRHKF